MLALSRSRKHIVGRWTLTLTLAVVSALAIHFARIYPWHSLYLPESSLAVFDNLAARPISSNTTCFLPGATAVNSTSFKDAVPIGSTDGAGLASDLCFHYDSRFKPYDGGTGGNTYITRAQEQLALPSSVAITGDLIWLANLLAEHEPKSYPHVDWTDATLLSRCDAMQARPSATADAEPFMGVQRPRVAFVVRCYQDFNWSHDAIVHLRALVWELRSSKLEFEVDVHILLEVKDAAVSASMFSNGGRKRILRGSVPIEFWPLVTLWHEQEMLLRYPLGGDFRPGIRGADSYRGCLLPLQRFAVEHPEYESLINWEIDTRFTHTYDRMLESMRSYAFRASAQTYTRWPVRGHSSESHGSELAGRAKCINKSADVIVLSPVRNPQDSGWYWEYDVQGFASMQSTQRAASVGTNMWLSRRAVLALEDMSANEGESFFCEAMAPSLAFRSVPPSASNEKSQCETRFKLVHYPHPVAFRYQATPAKMDNLINPARASLSKQQEQVLKDASYYYASTIAERIYAQWQSRADACIMPLILHPVKTSTMAPATSSQRSRSFGGWILANPSGPASLCVASMKGSQCADFVKTTIRHYTGHDPGDLAAMQAESLFQWDLKRPRVNKPAPLAATARSASVLGFRWRSNVKCKVTWARQPGARAGGSSSTREGPVTTRVRPDQGFRIDAPGLNRGRLDPRA
ncbi:uncharacterized protein PAN0_014c4813 [Moesziomyces antarcticus]|uniref:Uncharacterized protein n=1 Tax=Pseudozyma antarctica TaxID=84753 RepID=A0A081CIU4_PSEA2|nr:uncharacterized protein PAN0_014c4813 [Moesziomyces antarcticus]GAK66590.1 conserved hypothetical protein [Moesziomyces antarcticus]